ncbi:MAG: uroporphyrinogen-III C-methyltransferase [Ignavibacteria bacterium]|nr:uroporphyrinogen-III C-methyltransferase [Ignavibacteria bacterium]
MNSKNGKVFIVGAGPGDPGLITLNALQKLKQADVVVYDRLINCELLSFCREDCERVFVGKESGHHLIEQEKITEILINKSKSGFNVVRLKGGDPFVFGRGSEEALDLKRAGIEFEIIPGITSGLSAPVYSGIPITQRGLITQCIFITAHECPDKPGTQVDWDKLAKLKNISLIIYMGASRIEVISQKLIKYGMDPATPAAAIENGTLPKQRTLTARLDKIAGEFKQQNFHAPVIIMVSPTVEFRKGISWYEKKPLFNKRIAVAGAQEQIDDLHNMLYNLGAEIFPLNVMRTQLNIPEINFKELFSEDNFEWILFTSKTGVKFFWELLKKENLDSRIFGNKKIAAVGPGLTQTIKSLGLNPDYSSEEFNPDSILNDFLEEYNIAGNKLLRILDDSPLDKISIELNKSGIKTHSVKVFDVLPNQPKPILIAELRKHYPDVLIFASKVSIDYFFNVLTAETATDLLNNCRSIVVDPVTPDDLINKNIQSKKISADYTINQLHDIFSKLN